MSILGKNVGIKIFILIFVVGFIVLATSRDKMNCMIATYNLNFNRVELTHSDSLSYMKKFDVRNTDFKLSLIELGGQGCKPCKKMEAELSTIKDIFEDNINLRIINVTKGEDKKVASYFGIRFIPVQIILAPDGEELFRHSGFITAEDLELEINKHLEN